MLIHFFNPHHPQQTAPHPNHTTQKPEIYRQAKKEGRTDGRSETGNDANVIINIFANKTLMKNSSSFSVQSSNEKTTNGHQLVTSITERRSDINYLEYGKALPLT